MMICCISEHNATFLLQHCEQHDTTMFSFNLSISVDQPNSCKFECSRLLCVQFTAFTLSLSNSQEPNKQGLFFHLQFFFFKFSYNNFGDHYSRNFLGKRHTVITVGNRPEQVPQVKPNPIQSRLIR